MPSLEECPGRLSRKWMTSKAKMSPTAIPIDDKGRARAVFALMELLILLHVDATGHGNGAGLAPLAGSIWMCNLAQLLGKIPLGLLRHNTRLAEKLSCIDKCQKIKLMWIHPGIWLSIPGCPGICVSCRSILTIGQCTGCGSIMTCPGSLPS